MITHLDAALAKINSHSRSYIIEEVDFGQPIGETTCIETYPGNDIIYAQRPKRFGKTRFVENRLPEPSSSVVVILKALAEPRTYVLITAFIGCRPEPEPWDRRNFSQQANPAEAEQRAREFWATHALVWGVEEVISGTETKRCPW